MSDCMIGFFSGICLFMLIEPLIVNFVYFTNIYLFMDIILTKKNERKLIKHIKENY